MGNRCMPPSRSSSCASRRGRCCRWRPRSSNERPCSRRVGRDLAVLGVGGPRHGRPAAAALEGTDDRDPSDPLGLSSDDPYGVCSARGRFGRIIVHQPVFTPTGRAGSLPRRRMNAIGMKALAIVPAYNEERLVGSRGRRDRSERARLRRARGRRRLHGRDGRCGPSAAGAHVLVHPFNLGIGGAMQTGFQYASRPRLRRRRAGRRRRPARPRADPGPGRARCASDGVDMVCGSRFLAEEAGYRVLVRRGATGITLFSRACCPRSAPARDRPDVRASALQPPRRSSCSRATTRTTIPRSRRS